METGESLANRIRGSLVVRGPATDAVGLKWAFLPRFEYLIVFAVARTPVGPFSSCGMMPSDSNAVEVHSYVRFSKVFRTSRFICVGASMLNDFIV
jgi:hypothetical protein